MGGVLLLAFVDVAYPLFLINTESSSCVIDPSMHFLQRVVIPKFRILTLQDKNLGNNDFPELHIRNIMTLQNKNLSE